MYSLEYKLSDRWEPFYAVSKMSQLEALEYGAWLSAMTLLEFRVVGGNQSRTIN